MQFDYVKRRHASPAPQPAPQVRTRARHEAVIQGEPEPPAPVPEPPPAPPHAAEPLGRAVAAALFFPIGAVLLAAVLFLGIKVHDPSATSLSAATPATLRPIVDQVLKVDVTAERLKDAFGTTAAANAAICTTEPLPALPPVPTARPAAPAVDPDPVKEAAAVVERRRVAREAKEISAATAKIEALKAQRARREACRALLAARLSVDQSVQTFAQILTDTIVETTLASGFVADVSKGLAKELDTATGKWLGELQRDAFTKRVVAGANATVGTIGAQDATRVEGSAADPVEAGVARVLSADRLEAALRRGLTADFRPGTMGNGVVGWSKDIGARLLWATTAFVFCAAFAFVMTAAFGQLREAEAVAADRWQRNGAIAVVFLVLLGILVPLMFGVNGLNTGPIEEALAFFGERYGLSLRVAIFVLNLLAVTGAVFLIVGAVATFLVDVATADEVKVQLSGLRRLFNAGAVFLLAGTLVVNALLRWPAIFYPDAIAQPLVAAANWMATAVGAVFTVVLLAVYLPSVTILHEQVRWLPDDQKKDAEAAFTAMGFGDTGIQQVSRLVQALAPLLTGLTLTVSQTL